MRSNWAGRWRTSRRPRRIFNLHLQCHQAVTIAKARGRGRGGYQGYGSGRGLVILRHQIAYPFRRLVQGVDHRARQASEHGLGAKDAMSLHVGQVGLRFAVRVRAPFHDEREPVQGS
jgi:hypothetical protein